jgi:hypothetical protein
MYSSLASHPLIKCLGEIFLPTYKADYSYFEHVRQTGISRPLELLRRKNLVYGLLDRLYDSSTESAIGFKYMYSHSWHVPYRFPMVMKYIKENDVRVLHLLRDSPLNTCVSRQMAKSTSTFHSRTVKDQPNIRIDIPLMMKQLKRIETQKARWRSRLRKLDSLEISYEEFVEKKRETSIRILDFLGVDHDIELVSPLKKLISRPLRETVENYSEMASAVKAAGYGQFLVE